VPSTAAQRAEHAQLVAFLKSHSAAS